MFSNQLSLLSAPDQKLVEFTLQGAVCENPTYLMVSQSKISNESIIIEHVLAQVGNLWLVLEMLVAFQHAPVKLHDLAKGKVLPWRFVQSSGSLNQLGQTCVNTGAIQTEGITTYHESIVVRCSNSHRLQTIIDEI